MAMTHEVSESQPPVQNLGPSTLSAPTIKRAAPFSVRVFDESADAHGRDAKLPTDFKSLMPAAYRTKEDHVVAATASLEFLEQEFLVDNIISVMESLWACGRPMPPRPLHHQVMLSREIFITENPHMHLVWGNKRIFLKPLPSYLLDSSFWKSHILRDDESMTRFHKVEGCARGFLFSYCSLIAYESDFQIAKDKGLVPNALTWDKWRQVSEQVLNSHNYATVSQRYWYGELRLGRLNLIYRFKRGSHLRGFSRINGHAVYGDLIQDNLATLASILGYVVIVLTAMQVGLATKRLSDNTAFQRASYGFTVFSILAPLIGIFLILVFVTVWVIVNYVATKRYEKRRFDDMGVETFWRRKAEEKASLVRSQQNPSGEA